MEEQKQNLFDFWEKYVLIVSTDSYAPTTPLIKICRFCNQDESSTTFTNIPHAIPELLGANEFMTVDECDKCNKHFSKYESHLSKFFLPYLAMVGVKGKKSTPAFHSRTENQDENTRTIIKSDGGSKRNITLNSSSLSDYKIDEENKSMSLTFRHPPHKPFWVYKALVKIAMSLLPNEHLQRYKNTFLWLLEKPSDSSCFITAFIKTLPLNKFARPHAELYLAKDIINDDSFLPELTLVLGFANLVVQIFLPLPDNFDYEGSGWKKPILNLYPSIIFDKQPNKEVFIINHIDLKSKESITYDKTIHFKFESADLNIHKSVNGKQLANE